MTAAHYQNKTQKLIYLLLQHKLAPTVLQVHNDSEKHKGHKAAQAQPLKGHFRVEISDPDKHAKAIDKHRAIYHSLRHIMERIHALQIHFIEE